MQNIAFNDTYNMDSKHTREEGRRMPYYRIVVTRHGGPEVLHLQEEELPEPAPGMVRIRVLTCGVSFTDVLIREGTYPGAPSPPFTSGYNLVGVVDRVGEGVSTLSPGDPVAALTVVGAYTQYLCLPEREPIRLPTGLDPVAAACLVMNYMTAYQMLYRIAHVQPGERILIQGATGGVGTAFLELGRLAGLEMYGTTSTERTALVTQLGGVPIDYKREDFVKRIAELTGDGVDVVFDGIGGEVARRSYRTLRKGGRLVMYGHYSTLQQGRKDLLKVLTFYANAAAVFVQNLVPGRKQVLLYQIAKLKERHPDWYREDLLHLMALLAQGKIAPIVAERIPLVEARRAHELLGKGGVSGTIVLLCQEPAPS
jgi:NADPH2:quinone reductase